MKWALLALCVTALVFQALAQDDVKLRCLKQIETVEEKYADELSQDLQTALAAVPTYIDDLSNLPEGVTIAAVLEILNTAIETDKLPLGQCVIYISTALPCVETTFKTKVCEDGATIADIDALLKPCEQFVCAELKAAIEDSCGPTDIAAKSLFTDKLDRMFSDLCKDSGLEAPQNILAMIQKSPEELSDLVQTLDGLVSLVGVFEPYFDLLPCSVKSFLARIAADNSDALFQLAAESIEGAATVAKIQNALLPYYSNKVCDDLINLGDAFLTDATITVLKDMNFECGDKSPQEQYLEDNSGNRRKRNADAGISLFLAEKFKDEECHVSCGRRVAKALLTMKQADLGIGPDPCVAVPGILGGLSDCLSDKDKEQFVDCDMSLPCVNTFKNKDRLARTLKEKNCDAATSNVCPLYCTSLNSNPCTALGDPREACVLTNKKCFRDLAEDLCQCADIGNRCDAPNAAFGRYSVDNIPEDIKTELNTLPTSELSKKQRKQRDRNALKDLKDKPNDDIVTNIVDNVKYFPLLPPDRRETLKGLLLTAYNTEQFIDWLINDLPEDVVPEEIFDVMYAFFERAMGEGKLPLFPVFTVSVMPPSIVKEYDIVDICSNDITVIDPRAVGLRFREYLEQASGVTYATATAEEKAFMFSDIDEDVNVNCLAFVNVDDLPSLPENVLRKGMLALSQNPDFTNKYQLDAFARKYLEILGKCDGETKLEPEDIEIEGMPLVLRVLDFSTILECADPLFLLEVLMEASDSILCLPDPVLEKLDDIIEFLQDIDQADLPPIYTDVMVLLNIQDELQDFFEEFLDEFLEHVEEVREECANADSQAQDSARDEMLSKQKDIVVALGSSRRKRSATIKGRFRRSTAYTCSEIEQMGEAVTTLTSSELQAISDQDFKECLDSFAAYVFPLDKRSMLWERAQVATALNNVCDLQFTHMDELGHLVYGMSESEIDCLTLNDDLMAELGVLDRWTIEQTQAISSKYLVTKGLSAADLTGEELVFMTEVICGFDGISDITPAELVTMAGEFGSMSTYQATTECMTDLLEVLKHADAFGPVSGWGTETFSEIGILAGGLTGEEFNTIDEDGMGVLSAAGIGLIHHTELAKADTDVLALLNSNQAQALTNDQLDALSDEQKQTVYDQGYGEYSTTAINDATNTGDGDGDGGDEDGDGDDDNDDSGSHGNQLAASATAMLVSLLVARWF